MRQLKRVVVFAQGQDDGEWPPTDATEFVAWFAEKIGEIPREYAASTQIEIDIQGHYDDCYAYIKIYYDRPETDTEMAAREAEELRREEAQKALKAQELRTLAALKAKYGG